jgi:NADH:ubiquinone oxidoreductase subunit F (NADH-binding)
LEPIILKKIPRYNELDVYMKHGGYNSLKKALKMKPDDIIEEVKK